MSAERVEYVPGSGRYAILRRSWRRGSLVEQWPKRWGLAWGLEGGRVEFNFGAWCLSLFVRLPELVP